MGFCEQAIHIRVKIASIHFGPPIDINQARSHIEAGTTDQWDSEFIQWTNRKQGGPQSNLAVNSYPNPIRFQLKRMENSKDDSLSFKFKKASRGS
jgi:hypothetical protein